MQKVRLWNPKTKQYIGTIYCKVTENKWGRLLCTDVRAVAISPDYVEEIEESEE